MSRKMRELLNKLAALETEAQALLDDANATEEQIKSKTGEIKAMKAKIDTQKQIDDGKTFDENGIEIIDSNGGGRELIGSGSIIVNDEKEANRKYKAAFLRAFRGRATAQDFEILNAMTSSNPADGGFLVPEDVQTRINEYKRSLPDLTTLINVVPVNTDSGSRVFEKIATMAPLANITDDTADIADMGNPQFENITYNIKKYAGWMPVPNDLLKDSDQAILDYLVGWIARKSVVTRNNLIVTLLGTLNKVAFADWKAIKKALNVTLDPMLAAGASILTNQDGFQYLDTLVDGQNRPLVQPDVTQPSNKVVFGKPIVVVPNTVMLTTGTTTKKAPFVVGNFIELVAMFERQGHEVASTNIGGTAFRKDRTEIRVIEREDVKLIDSAAAVYGELDVTATV